MKGPKRLLEALNQSEDRGKEVGLKRPNHWACEKNQRARGPRHTCRKSLSLQAGHIGPSPNTQTPPIPEPPPPTITSTERRQLDSGGVAQGQGRPADWGNSGWIVFPPVVKTRAVETTSACASCGRPSINTIKGSLVTNDHWPPAPPEQNSPSHTDHILSEAMVLMLDLDP
ncbi:hypothetical protein DPEC_G00038990 [Dallia pectoralis]|uniref:Uncharacterized protein n=1 Tax=Dallia pectoralis TaxID=75939 RepID=A0ACC2HEQ0_DALPE|nr:hypothetical protein DPEC_G00038990 [Dallia pectoralis]